MHADVAPLVVGILIFISSLVSLKLGLSVAIIEITLGAVAGNLGLEAQPWMTYLATFGGILLTFLAGTGEYELTRQPRHTVAPMPPAA